MSRLRSKTSRFSNLDKKYKVTISKQPVISIKTFDKHHFGVEQRVEFAAVFHRDDSKKEFNTLEEY